MHNVGKGVSKQVRAHTVRRSTNRYNSYGRQFGIKSNILMHILLKMSPEDIFSLLLERGEGGREREKCQLVASRRLPDQDQTRKPRHVPCLGIEPTTFWCTG